MRRRLIFALPVSGMLLLGSAGLTLPPSVRMFVALAFFSALAITGWRIAGALAPEADALSRAASAGLVAAATISVPATALGGFGLLSPRALLLAVLGAFLASAVLRGRPAAAPSGVPGRVETFALLAIAGAFAGLLVNEAAALRFAPPGTRSYDDPSYHLSAVATWRTFGDLRMIKFPVGDPSTAFYPIAGELFTFGLLAPIDPSDFFARFGELPFALLSLLAIAAVARRLGLSPASQAVAAFLFLAGPRFLDIAFSAGTDHATGFFVLAAVACTLDLAERPTAGRALLAGLALGLLAGTKYTGFQFVFAILPLVVVATWRRWRLVPVALASAAVAGGYTYLRNFVATGNPIFPAQVRLLGKTLFPGWVDPAGFAKSEIFSIDVPRFLFRPDLFGAFLPWILVPAALAAWLVAAARRGEPPALRVPTALALALPIAVFLEFRFLMIDHRDSRYLFGGIALAGVCAVWLVERLPPRWVSAARFALAATALLSAAAAAGPEARVAMAWGAAALLLFETLRRALHVPLRRVAIAGACAAVPLAAFAAPVLARYGRERAGFSAVLRALDERTRAAPATVAFVGSNQPYFCWGNDLQNRVLFVPTFAEPRASWYAFRSGLSMPHERTSRPEWWANVVGERVRYVVVVRDGSEMPELAWMDAEPARFERLASEGTSELFEVRPGGISGPVLVVDAAGAHLSSYLEGDWAMERGLDGSPLFQPLGEARLRLPRFELAARAVRLELADPPMPGVATLRSCDDLVAGRFPTDGASDVSLALPTGFDATCIAVGAERPGGGAYRVGRTERFAPVPLRAKSASAWFGNAVTLTVGETREVRRGSGYTFALLSPDGSRFSEVRTFDTSRDSSVSRGLAAWVAALPSGAVVLGGVADDASGITEEGVAALRRLGCALDVRGRFRIAHAFIGVAGATPGSVPEWTDARAALVAAPDEPLRLRSLSVVLDDKRVPRQDPGLLSAVDNPAEGSVARDPLVVRGWCQERGGKPVAPTGFLIDGHRLAMRRVDRVPRPDVCTAITGMGDCGRAGFEALLDTSGLAPGPHVLVVRFDAPDGRYRLYEPRAFVFGR